MTSRGAMMLTPTQLFRPMPLPRLRRWLVALSAGAVTAAPLQGQMGASGDPRILVDTGSVWRTFYTWRPSAQVHDHLDWREAMRQVRHSAGPPVGWRLPPAEPPRGSLSIQTGRPGGRWGGQDSWHGSGYDDSGWGRSVGPFPPPGTPLAARTLDAIRLRAQFRIEDPAAVDPLLVELEYVGGAAVWVNGRLVGWADMAEPTRRLEPTAASPYPAAAYRAAGAVRWGAEDPFLRRLGPVPIPAPALRPGTNTVAILVRRAAPTEGLSDPWRADRPMPSVHVARIRTEARVERGRPVTPPPDWRAYAASPLERIAVSWAAGNPLEPPARIRLVAPRNGPASGQTLLHATIPIRNLRAEMGPVVHTTSGNALPESAARVRYAAADGRDPFDLLLDAPPPPRETPGPRNPVQPVWVTFDVPADAEPGPYEGDLRIEAEGLPALAVPVHLTVGAWTAPSPRAFQTWLGIAQSPDILARTYGVAPWSDEHLALVDRSLGLLGALGVNTAALPLLCDVVGNADSLAWRILGGDEDWDFRPAEAYLDRLAAHLGTRTLLALHVWNPSLRYPAADPLRRSRPPQVTARDAVTGATLPQPALRFGEPEAEAFWAPLIEGIRRRAVDRGWEASSLVLAQAFDARPDDGQAAFARRVAPYAGWSVRTFENPPVPPRVGDHPAAHTATAMPDLPLTRGEVYGWEAPWARTLFPRGRLGDRGQRRPWLSMSAPLGLYRTVPEMSLAAGYRGLDGLGADFWSTSAGSSGLLINHNQAEEGLGLLSAVPHLLGRGHDGPVATIRYEMLRQGLVEAEARIFLEQRLRHPERRASISNPDAVRTLLRRRVDLYLTACEAAWLQAGAWGLWDDRAWELFEMAGRVQAQEAAP